MARRRRKHRGLSGSTENHAYGFRAELNIASKPILFGCASSFIALGAARVHADGLPKDKQAAAFKALRNAHTRIEQKCSVRRA